MPSKKKTTKKSHTKKPVNKKPAVKTSATKPVKPVAKPVAAKISPRWDIWIPILVIVVPLVFSVLYVVNRPADKATTGQSSQSTSDSSSELRVIPSQEGGPSSTQASGALQPQPAGLQQSQPTTQSADGLNLQAQDTPDQTTIR